MENCFQRHAQQLSSLYAEAAGGALVWLDTIAEVTSVLGSLTVNHFPQIPLVTIPFNTAPGYSLGQATEAAGGLARKELPGAIMCRFGGTAQTFEESMDATYFKARWY